MTGLPSFSKASRRSSPCSLTRMHPALADVPIDAGSLVPWIASEVQPLHPGGRFGWIPEMPNAKVPSDPPEGKGMRSVTKYSPGGVGEIGSRRGGQPRQSVTELRHGDPVIRQIDVDLHMGRRAREVAKRYPPLATGPRRYGISTRPQRPWCAVSSTQAVIGPRSTSNLMASCRRRRRPGPVVPSRSSSVEQDQRSGSMRARDGVCPVTARPVDWSRRSLGPPRHEPGRATGRGVGGPVLAPLTRGVPTAMTRARVVAIHDARGPWIRMDSYRSGGQGLLSQTVVLVRCGGIGPAGDGR